MNYVFVESGTIIEYPSPLPLNWRNISNLPALNNDQLRSYGWYPCVFVAYQGSMDGKVFAPSLFEFNENEYIEYQQVRDKTPEEIAQETESQWQSVRARRNFLLSECDWTQLPDVDLTEEVKQEWVIYRRDLRNITDNPDPFNIVWPTPPASPAQSVAQ
jgi:hypothetical protein